MFFVFSMTAYLHGSFLTILMLIVKSLILIVNSTLLIPVTLTASVRHCCSGGGVCEGLETGLLWRLTTNSSVCHLCSLLNYRVGDGTLLCWNVIEQIDQLVSAMAH